MDEEVLQDLYNRAQSKGYTKSFEDFVVLIQADKEVQDDMFSYVQEQGYQKNIEDFQQLIGVKKRFRFTCSGGSYGIYYRSGNTRYFFGILRRSY